MASRVTMSSRHVSCLNRNSRALGGWLFGVFLGLLSVPAPGAAYLRIPDVPGESADKSHVGWIEVSGVRNILDRAAGAGAVTAAALGFDKRVDRSTPKVVDAMCRGLTFPTVELDVTRPGVTSTAFYRIVLSNVRLSSYRLGAGASEAREELEISFDKAQWTYTEFSSSGRGFMDHQAAWDFVRNEGGFTSRRLGFLVRSVVQSNGRLGVQWSPEVGRPYTLLRSSRPEGPYEPIRDLGVFSTPEPVWAELPTGARFDFFMVRQEE